MLQTDPKYLRKSIDQESCESQAFNSHAVVPALKLPQMQPRPQILPESLKCQRTHMQHGGNGLHLDGCWDMEACSLDILHDFRVHFVLLLELIKGGNGVREICSLNVDPVLVPEAIDLQDKNTNSFFLILHHKTHHLHSLSHPLPMRNHHK